MPGFYFLGSKHWLGSRNTLTSPTVWYNITKNAGMFAILFAAYDAARALTAATIRDFDDAITRSVSVQHCSAECAFQRAVDRRTHGIVAC